ncbi:TetR/AcrR family transcriptional regulator [Nocardia sp. NPDC059239]|uniref:TetR/AcrR family transcriptional regulator n=1 Tax=unclassified Nocardia TaxID=2637762 RepID=UPI00368DB1D1
MNTDRADKQQVRGKPTCELAPRSNPRRELVEKQIFEQAIALFSERGFAATTLQDIAKATGLTRPALYHYVDSKDDLLAKLVDQDSGGIADQLNEIRADTTRSASDRLHTMVYDSALRLARDPARFLLLLRSERELPDELFRAYDSGRRRVLKEFTVIIKEGVGSGEFRPVDARVAALAIIGMTNWIAWWYGPDQKPDEEALARQFADMAVGSVTIAGKRPEPVSGPAQAIALLRQDLNLLEGLIDGK